MKLLTPSYRLKIFVTLIGMGIFLVVLTPLRVSASVLSGTVFVDQGSTPAPAGITLNVVIATATPSVHSVVTTSGGVWSLSGISTSSIATTTPIIAFIDASSTDATTLVAGYGGDSITGIPLYFGRVVSYGSSSDSVVAVQRFTYDRDQDNDVLFASATTSTSTIFFAPVIVERGVFAAHPSVTILAGSLTNNATFSHQGGVLILAGTGAAITGSVTGSSSLGNIRVIGTYTMPTNASTTAVVIDPGGSLTAPAQLLTSNYFANEGSFVNNSGTVQLEGPALPVLTPLVGRDTNSGGINSIFQLGNILYVGQSGVSGTCSSTVATGCELLIYDISSTSNPVYLNGLDIAGKTVNSLVATTSALYVTSVGSAATCSDSVLTGCELMVFSLSSSTNPVYVAGREPSQFPNENITMRQAQIVGSHLFVTRNGFAEFCNGVTAIRGCELQIFSIASTTNPIPAGGLDPAGATIISFITEALIFDNRLFTGAAANNNTCSALNRTGCELSMWNLSSTTNPVFIDFEEAAGASDLNSVTAFAIEPISQTLYVGKDLNSGTCSASLRTGCEVMLFAVSSTTNMQYIGGIDLNRGVTDLEVSGYTLYISKELSFAGTCSATDTTDCELLLYDISSSTQPQLLTGYNSAATYRTIQHKNNLFFTGSGADFETCSLENFLGCELGIWQASPTTIARGRLVGGNALATLVASGTVAVLDNASTSALVINTGMTTLGGNLFSSSGGITNNANLVVNSPQTTITDGNYTNNGTVQFDNRDTATLTLLGANQSLLGTLTATSALPNVVLGGSGTKTLASAATATSFTVASGVTVEITQPLTVLGDFTNNGTFQNAGTVDLSSVILTYRGGGQQSGEDRQIRSFTTVGSTLYVAKAGGTGTCSSAVRDGCELLVFDISSTTNPVYIGGEESGDNQGINSLTTVGSTLYVAKEGSTGTCSSTVRDGCELLIYDISSTTNPVYIGGEESWENYSISALTARNGILYAGVESYDSPACDSNLRTGCELLVFDISSTTNPVYVGGKDTGVSTGVRSMTVTGQSLYVGQGYFSDLDCPSITPAGCGLLVFDLGSTTNPVLVGGQPYNPFQPLEALVVVDATLYAGGSSYSPLPCSELVRAGCELLVFDISSSTNPVYVSGVRLASDAEVSDLQVSGTRLYVGRLGGDGTTCTVASGTGCTVLGFDISSTTNPVFVGGQRLGGFGVNTLAIVDSGLYVGSWGDSATCSSTNVNGCELVYLDRTATVAGNLTASSALGQVLTRGQVRFLANASTTHFTNFGNVVAPSTLSISRDFLQLGQWDAASGTLFLLGTTSQVATGTLTGTSAPHQLTITNQSGNGTTSQAVIFGAAVDTTGTFTMVASTSARFLASTTNVFAAVDWTGTAGSPVWLRSSAEGSQWEVVAESFVSTSFIDVRDSLNSSVDTIFCSTGCIDSGNNTGWSFLPPTTGLLTLGEHPEGPADNIFSFKNEDDAVLYRFNLTAATETAIINDVSLSLIGLQGVDTSELVNWRLYYDVNSDGLLDGGDVAVLGTGIFAIADNTGTVTFSTGTTSVTTATPRRYLVVADTVAIDNNDWLNIQLRPGGVVATGLLSGSPTLVVGSVSASQQIRANAGGSGLNRLPIGGEGVAGAGVQTGGAPGNSTARGEVGQSTDGANIAPDPNFQRPTNTGSPDDQWTEGAQALLSDGLAAEASGVNLRQSFGGFGFTIPSTNVIQGIEVKLDASGSTAAGTIQIGLSSDGGSTVTTLEATPTLSGSDIVYTVGSQTNLWGYPWVPSDFSDTNFRLRVIAQPSSNIVRLDAVEVRVYHTAGGGAPGGGGGGEI